MNPKQTAIVAAIVLAALAGVVILLLTGGPGEPATSVDDPVGDVSVTQGPDMPTNRDLVDIVHAEVSRDGSELRVEVQMNTTIPQDMDDGELNWRWTISVDGRDAWLLSARINIEPNATIVSQLSDYSASTVDDTMPGEITVEGDTVTITLDPSEVPDFPTKFSWALQAMLDANLSDPGSGMLQDLAPDSGTAQLEE